MINNVKTIYTTDGDFFLIQGFKWAGQVRDLWHHYVEGKPHVSRSPHCMKEYIIQQIHAGHKVTITGEIMVIE